LQTASRQKKVPRDRGHIGLVRSGTKGICALIKFPARSRATPHKLNAWVLQNLLNNAQIESVSIRLSNPGTDIGLDDQIADSVLRTCNLTGASQRRLQCVQALQSV
jgi:hypothetical protein